MKGSGLLVMNQGEADTKSQEKTLVSSDPPQGSSLSSHPIVHAIPNHVAVSWQTVPRTYVCSFISESST